MEDRDGIAFQSAGYLLVTSPVSERASVGEHVDHWIHRPPLEHVDVARVGATEILKRKSPDFIPIDMGFKASADDMKSTDSFTE